MPYHDLYKVKSGDNLSRIAKAHGLQNPGPIVAYPPNQAYFRRRSPDLIHPGDRILIPYCPDLLTKIMATSQHLASEIAKTATRLINQQQSSKKKLQEFLFMIDAANFLASMAVSIGTLAAQGARGAEMTSKEALMWLADYKAAQAGGIISTFVVPAPRSPKKDFKFFVRHTLGPWNPSFWASVWVAVQEGDVDIYLYGPDATAYKTAQRIKKQADADIAKLNDRMAEARRQLAMPFYKHRI